MRVGRHCLGQCPGTCIREGVKPSCLDHTERKKNEQCDGGTRTALIQRGGKLSGSWDDARGRRIPGAAGVGDPLADHARTGASW